MSVDRDQQQEPSKFTRQIRLLVVDDNPIFMRSLGRLLTRDAGLSVVGTVGSAREALDSARALKPDLVLLDLRMPQVSGYDLIPQLCADLPDLKIIAMSLDGSTQVERATQERGAHAFILKEQLASKLVPLIYELCQGNVTTGLATSPKEAITIDTKEKHFEREDWKEHTVEQLELTKKVIEKAQDNLEQARNVIQDTQDAIRDQTNAD